MVIYSALDVVIQLEAIGGVLSGPHLSLLSAVRKKVRWS